MAKSLSLFLFACLFIEVGFGICSCAKMLFDFGYSMTDSTVAELSNNMLNAQIILLILLFGISQWISLVFLFQYFQVLEKALDTNDQYFCTMSQLKDCILYCLPPFTTLLKESEIILESSNSESAMVVFVPFKVLRISLFAMYPVLVAVVFSNKMLLMPYPTDSDIHTIEMKGSVRIENSLNVTAFNDLQKRFSTFLKYHLSMTVLLEIFAIYNASVQQPDLVLTSSFWTTNAVSTIITVAMIVVFLMLFHSYRWRITHSFESAIQKRNEKLISM